MDISASYLHADLSETFLRLFSMSSNVTVMSMPDVDSSALVRRTLAARRKNPALLYLLTMSTNQSREKVTRTLNQISREFGASDFLSCPWEDLDQACVLGLKTRWEIMKKAPATINFALTVLRGVFKQMWLNESISDRTYTAVQSIRRTRGSRDLRGRALSHTETLQIISHCEATGTLKGLRDAAIFAVGLGCGLRRSEICSLQVSNILVDDRSIELIGKGNKMRRVFCPEDVWSHLSAWMKAREAAVADLKPEAPVFCCFLKGGHIKHEKPLTDHGVYRMMVDCAEELGIKNCSPHDLRRTYATRLFQMGGDANLVRRAMGHSSVVTTQRYDRRPDDEVRHLTSRLTL